MEGVERLALIGKERRARHDRQLAAVWHREPERAADRRRRGPPSPRGSLQPRCAAPSAARGRIAGSLRSSRRARARRGEFIASLAKPFALAQEQDVAVRKCACPRGASQRSACQLSNPGGWHVHVQVAQGPAEAARARLLWGQNTERRVVRSFEDFFDPADDKSDVIASPQRRVDLFPRCADHPSEAKKVTEKRDRKHGVVDSPKEFCTVELRKPHIEETCSPSSAQSSRFGCCCQLACRAPRARFRLWESFQTAETGKTVEKSPMRMPAKDERPVVLKLAGLDYAERLCVVHQFKQ